MMKKRGLSKRILAFVLSFMMVIALVPMNAITVKAEGVPDCPHCGGTGLVCGGHVSSSHRGQDYSNMNSCRGPCIVDAKGKCAMHGQELSYECEHCKRGSACIHSFTDGKCSICGYACKHSLISSSVSYLANADYHWKKTCIDCGASIDKESHTDTNNDGICDTCRYSSSSGAILPGNNTDEFKLNICNIPSEGGSTYCEKMPISYSQGTSATFTAKPNPGYRFKGWYAMKSSNASGELGTCLSSEETYTITPSAVDTYKTCDSGLSSKKTYSVYIAAVYEDSTVHTHSKGTYHEAASSTCIAAGNIEYWDCCLCEAKIDVNDNVIEDITIPREKVITSVIDTNSNGFEGEGCENLLDSNTDTKWCCSFDGETFVVIKASEPVIISNYTITTAGDTSQYKDRNPKSWTLLACNDYNEAEKTGTWEEIDSISNGDMPNKNTTAKTFNISSTKKYQYYKWNVTSIVGGSILQVSQFELYALHSFENNDANTHKCSFCNTTGEHDFSTSPDKCSICGFYADSIGTKLAGYSLSLHDNIGVDFYMELEDSVMKDEGAKFIVKLEGDSIAEIPVSEARTTTVNGNTYYVFECRVAAAQMTGCISAKIVLGDGTEGTEYQFTVQDYAKYILEHEAEYEEVVPVVKAMLRYGASAQNYFGHNTDKMADEILSEADRTAALTTPELTTYNYSAPEATDTISFLGTSLLLESEVSLKCYFYTTVDLQYSNVIVKYGDKVLDTSDYRIGKNGNVQYVTVTGLTPADYGKQFTITVQDITVENVSAYGYMAQAFKQMGDSDKLTDLLKNMYAYGEAYKKCYKLL